MSHPYNTRSKRKRSSTPPPKTPPQSPPSSPPPSSPPPQDDDTDANEFDSIVKTLRVNILSHIKTDITNLGISTNNKKVKGYLKSLQKGLDRQLRKCQRYYRSHKTDENNLACTARTLSNDIAGEVITMLLECIQNEDPVLEFINTMIESSTQSTSNSAHPLPDDDADAADSDVDEHGNIKDLIDYSVHDEWYGEYQNLEQLCQQLESPTPKRRRIQIEIKDRDNSSDEDYILESTSESSESDSESDSEESESDEEQSSKKQLVTANEWARHFRIPERHLLDSLDWKFIQTKAKKVKNDDCNDVTYFRQLPSEEKTEMLDKIDEIQQYSNNDTPLVFRTLYSKIPLEAKSELMRKVENLSAGGGDNAKLYDWAQGILKIPFGTYQPPFDSSELPPDSTGVDKLTHCQECLDKAVFGHDKAKNKILQILAQRLSNPTEQSGLVLGIQGPMGNGKTTLIEQGVSKALGLPFTYIPLGGATDSSFMEGHSYTYEGSQPGKIVEILTSAKCMNPIIYFDELDKVSTCPKGVEITNVLMHLTDPAQNSHFQDRYFTGVDLDLSKATFIFSYNDEDRVNPILLDRITEIDTRGFKNPEKIKIVRDYLWPALVKTVNRKPTDFEIDDDTLNHLIDHYTMEGGVRSLKKILEHVVREINLRHYYSPPKSNLLGRPVSEYPTPLVLNREMICKDILQDRTPILQELIGKVPMIGRINGLFATCNDTGGLCTIESRMIPMSQTMDLQLTGQQGSVMKESMKVAKSVAWQYVPARKKSTLRSYWKDHPEGFHIHCPEGATPKDGPSAGTAITIVLLSLLLKNPIRNDIAITGEINLQGDVMIIGGLLHKCYGAYKAGVRTVLYPKDNENHMIQIKKDCPELWTDPERFKALPVSHVSEVFRHVFVEPF